MDEIVASRVRELVSDHLGVGADELQPSVLLVDELAADSLDLVELSLDLESEFDIEVPERLLGEVRTFGDLVNLTLTLAGKRRAAHLIPDQPPRIWTHLVSPNADYAAVDRTVSLTPYTVEEVGADAVHSGPGTRLEVTVTAAASDGVVAWVADQFAWLQRHGVHVMVDRAQPAGKRPHGPEAA